MKSRPGIIVKLLLIVSLFTLVALGGVACGSSEEPTEEATTEEKAEAPAPAPAEEDATEVEEAPAESDTEEQVTEVTGGDDDEEEMAEKEEEMAEEEEEPEITAKSLTNLNVREGPSTDYPRVGKLEEGDEVMVIGKVEDGSWIMIKGDFGEAWISADPELAEVDTALLANVEVVDAPPPPYPISNPKVQEVLNQIPLVVHHENNITCASHGGLNKLLPDVVVGHVMGPHAGDFVRDGNNVLFKRTNNGFVLINENSVARFENGEEELSFVQAMKGFANGRIIWNGNFGDPGRGVTGCDPSAG